MNMIKNISRIVLFLGVASSFPSGYAADTDIYARPPVTTVDPALNPNVLVVIDNSANWASAAQHWPGGVKQGESELRALRTVIGELNETTNVGLMLFTAGTGTHPNGGYVRFAIRPMTAANKSALTELIGFTTGCVDGANSLNGTPNCIIKNFNGSEKTNAAATDYSAVMLDVYKYFGGYTWPLHATDNVAGANINSSQFGTMRYAGDPSPYSDPAAYTTDANKTSYNSPLSSINNCAKNYVIFIGNGYPSQDSPSTLLGPPSLLPGQSVGGDVTQLPLANLTSSNSTITNLVAQPACGTFAGATAADSLAACQVQAGGTFTVTAASPAVFTRTAHGLVAGNTITLFTTGSLPKGLATLTTYFVLTTPTVNTFTVSLTAGGAAINTTGTQSGTHTYTSLAFATQYPGYTSYSCTSNTMCSSGSTTTSTTNLGNSACGAYSTQAACQAALPTAFPGYTSYSCSAGTACTSNSSNSTTPIATTPFIPNDLSVAANCVSYGNTNYPSYSGFSCTASTNVLTVTKACVADSTFANQGKCDTYAGNLGSPWTSTTNANTCVAVSTTGCPNNASNWKITSTQKQWNMDATTLITSGNTYTMFGTGTSTVTSTSYSQNIFGTYTTTAATPNGTFSAPTAKNTNYFDEWARFINQTDVSAATGKQNINTFTIDVFKDMQDVNETSLLISAAQAGGGKYFAATDETGITNAMRKIFSEIQSVNSVFASSSLPVSVNTQGTYLNQIFMGMFRPDGTAAPRWFGNVKQYQFKIINGILRLADKNGNAAISTTTGFITPCAVSFWSTDTGQYWNYGGSNALGDCTAMTSAFPAAGSTSAYSDAPDGEVVEKGGAAQRLRGVYSSGTTLVSSSTNYALCTGSQTPATAQCRKMLTCDGTNATSCTALTSFDTSNGLINATTLNIVDATQVNNLINWTRGQDVDNENANLDASLNPIINEMRPSVHGGVIHAQPAVIDYGGTIGTMAYYGDDQGAFHAVVGNQSDTDGVELWSFIAPETYGKLNRQRTNSPLVAYPSVSGSPAPTPKDYFFDGSTGVYQNAAAAQVWIFPAMRRGGRAIYAFDVSTPSAPVLKWRRGCFTSDTADNSMCSSGWTGIGQTWSAPQIAYLNGYNDLSGKQKPVLIFGGGYDTCEDTNSQTRCGAAGTSKGANIWIVDADTGTILRIYPTNYSVAGDLATLTDTNKNLTYVYATDTGGYVYRINIGSVDTTGTIFAGWSSNAAASNITLASMSETNQARKFLYGPSVIQTADYNAVLLGSGDREHPLVSDYACGNYSAAAGNYVTNQFYMLMDKPAAYPGTTWTPSSLADVTSGSATATTSGTVTTITNAGGSSSTIGWRFNFGQCEQTVNKALTIAGVTYFGTNTPSSTTGSSCMANLGIANGYSVDYLTGNATGGVRYAQYIGGGMPPSPVAGVVSIDGVKLPFCIGCTSPPPAPGTGTPAVNQCTSALEGCKVNINPTGSRYRSYWYIEND